MRTAYERMQTRGETGICPAFAYIGQPWSSCDLCGRPFSEHSHEKRLGSGGPFAGRWRHVIIPTDLAERMRGRGA